MHKNFLFCLGFLYFTLLAGADPAAWKENFEKTVVKDNKPIPLNWWNRPGAWLSPATDFFVEKIDGKNVLKVSADKSTGALMYNLSGLVDLNKTPILRWRWKAQNLPPGADGRARKVDDQVVAIYIGTGTVIYKAIAYRWETETPKGTEEDIAYGPANIKWYCLRNKTDSLQKWYVEERNIAADFKKAYGFIPDKFLISIAGNSQYTKSKTEAFIDWIEFVPQQPSGFTLKK